MKIQDILKELECLAPKALQESYDNARLIVGDEAAACKGVLVSIDCTEVIVDEAIRKGANLIVSHHPIVFSGLKSLTGKNYIERTLIKAIKADIAIYAIHTNLDNVLSGVNAKISDKLGLINRRILAPKSGLLKKLTVYVPISFKAELLKALFQAGAGSIGDYDECSFSVTGEGTFRPGLNSSPFVGKQGERHMEPEERVEVILPAHAEIEVMQAMRKSHPYEEIAFDLIKLENSWSEVGSGMIGELPEPEPTMEFLKSLKTRLNTSCVRFTKPNQDKVLKVALCGGSGSFLIDHAISNEADVFITGDMKYHQFFDADEKLVIADVGHYESEQFTIELIAETLEEKFPTFAVHLTKENTNPINYL